MLQELTVVILVILIINAFLFFAIKSISKKLNADMKKLMLKKLEVYDDIIDKKESRLSELNNIVQVDLEDEETEQKRNISNHVVTNISINDEITSYEDESFFENYLLIKNNFNFDYKAIVEEFVRKNDYINKSLHNLYKSINKKINLELYYELLKNDEEDRKAILLEVLSENEKNIVLEYEKANEKFDLVEFVDYIKEQVSYSDPTILIKGNKKFKYLEKIDSRISVKEDNSIIEGIQILYQGKIIDYSL